MARATPVELRTLSPFHYHSFVVPSGTATMTGFLVDRSTAYALANAMGALAASPALPEKDYARDLHVLPWLFSMLESGSNRLLPPSGRRLNLDQEGGYGEKIQAATGTGNLKSWYFVQEVPPGTVYRGVVFGPDPFALASEAAGAPVDDIVMRTGCHLGGLLRMTRGRAMPQKVRLNAHTAMVFGDDLEDADLRVEVFVLYDIQVTQPIAVERAAAIVDRWRPDLAA
jgi:hypothetical protein